MFYVVRNCHDLFLEKHVECHCKYFLNVRKLRILYIKSSFVPPPSPDLFIYLVRICFELGESLAIWKWGLCVGFSKFCWHHSITDFNTDFRDLKNHKVKCCLKMYSRLKSNITSFLFKKFFLSSEFIFFTIWTVFPT